MEAEGYRREKIWRKGYKLMCVASSSWTRQRNRFSRTFRVECSLGDMLSLTQEDL